MKRRDFLKQSLLASGATLIPSFLKGMESMSLDKISGYKNIIVIQLSGGNDGLNTIVPIKNDIYYKLRPKIAKSLKDTIRIQDNLAFNDNLKEIASLYDEGEMCIINNVGYPNPNRSHFRSSDIWHSASDSNKYINTGWLGRYLDANCSNPHHAIEVNKGLSLALKGEKLNGISAENPKFLYKNTQETFFKGIATNVDDTMLSEDNQGYLYKTLLETYSSAAYINENSKVYKTIQTYPNHKFGNNLKQIAQFINSGLTTRVYYSSLGGFDSHVNQLPKQDRLLKIYSKSVGALVNDLKKQNRFKDTLILTFTEFGRRVKENASTGTDHGTANNVTIISGSLKQAGVYNEIPNLQNLDANGDLQHSVDFRSVYATILNNWLEVDDTQILNSNFKKMNFV